MDKEVMEMPETSEVASCFLWKDVAGGLISICIGTMGSYYCGWFAVAA